MLNLLSADTQLTFGRQEIIRLVPVYKAETNYINSAYIDEDKLVCDLRSFKYPFAAIEIKHFTREHALLYITQAAYLLVAIYEKIDQDWPLTTEQALDLAINEQMTFTSVNINFRRFIRNQDNLKLQISITKFRNFSKRLALDFDYSFPKGCYGTCKGMVAIDKSLKMVF